MFCSFDGRPGSCACTAPVGSSCRATQDWDDLAGRFGAHAGARAVVVVELSRVADSCGYAVPRMQLVEERDVLERSHVKRRGRRPRPPTAPSATPRASTVWPAWTRPGNDPRHRRGRRAAGGSPCRRAGPPGPRPTGPARPCSRRSRRCAGPRGLAGARVLDLYAGSGAVGLEALSRGAAHVLLVEKDRRALDAVRANVAAARACPVPRWSPTTRRGWPPPPARPGRTTWCSSTRRTTSRRPRSPRWSAHLVAGGWPAPDALLVVERASRDGGLGLAGRGRAGAGPPVRRGHALVRSRGRAGAEAARPGHTLRRRERRRAQGRLPRVVRPGHQRAPRHHRAGRRRCSTRSP